MAAALAAWPALLVGLALSATGELTGRTVTGSPSRAVRLRALASLAAFIVGMSVFPRFSESGVVLTIAGLGGLAGWLPFAWRLPSEDEDLPPGAEISPVAVTLLRLAPVTTALIAGWKLTPTVFVPAADRALPVLYLTAAISLIAGGARLWSSGRDAPLCPLLSALALAGIVADVSLSREQTRLPVDVPSGGAWGLAAAVEAFGVLVVLASLQRSTDRPGTWPRWVERLARFDLGGVPPLPGFWLRSGLLLALVSRQSPSNITGEFEPPAGLLALALLAAAAWGLQLATAIASGLNPAERPPHDPAEPRASVVIDRD